jgi:hypothetical protein
MSDLNYDVDAEIGKYIDAYNIKRSGLGPSNLPFAKRRYNPVTGQNDVLSRMENGGYYVAGSEPIAMTEAPAQPQAPIPDEAPTTDIGPQVESLQQYVQNNLGGKFEMADLEAAGYSQEVINAAGYGTQPEPMFPPKPQADPENPEPLDEQEIAEIIASGQPMFQVDPTLRQEGSRIVSTYFFDLAVDGLRQELEEQYTSQTGQPIPPRGSDDYPRSIEEELRTREGELLRNAEVYSNALFGTGATGFEVGAGDFLTAGVMDIQEGYRMFNQQRDENGGTAAGRAIGVAIMAAGVAEATGVGYAFGKLLKRGAKAMQPAIVRMGEEAQGRIDAEGATLFSNPVGPIVDRGLAAAGRLVAPEGVKIGPPSDVPMVSQLQPQYRVTVENAPIIGTGKQSFIPKKMTPKNYDAASGNLQTLETEFADPLASQENYALMMSRVQNATEVPAPPAWMIEHANDTDKWADWFKGLTKSQIKAADDGLAIQEDFKAAYNSGAGPELTGQLMLWSILSRRMSAFPHEGGYLELAEAATPFIQKAARGEWTDADTEQWLAMVPTTIPQGTPGRSAISNANDFGKVFLKKMAAVDENGVSALSKLHDMIADPNMTSAEIRRAYYGLAEDTGIANKILSFALLVSGRNDVVVLDRIQINRMWAGGEKIYDDVYTQFEGAQGLAQYEALERSLASRIDELYAKAGRTDGSVGKYHWESWVLSSGQVVSHPTLKAVVGSGSPSKGANIKPTELTPVAEGRFHVKYSGVVYEKTPGGKNRYVYSTSDGTPYEFTKKQLDDMFKEVFKKKSGVLPDNFPGVSAFEGGNKPWYEFEGVDRGKFDAIIRQSGKSVSD